MNSEIMLFSSFCFCKDKEALPFKQRIEVH